MSRRISNPYSLELTEEIQALADHIQSLSGDFHIRVERTDPLFFLTDDDLKELPPGPFGITGCAGPFSGSVESEEKKTFKVNPKKMTISIDVVVPTVAISDYIGKKFFLTNGARGNPIKTFTHEKITTSEEIVMGYYKREGFDDAYQALKKMKQDITEREFAQIDADYGPDAELVEKKAYIGEEGLLNKFTEFYSVDTGRTRLTISLLGYDISPNLDSLKSYLTAISHNAL